MNDRNRFGRSREQGGFGQQERRPWDRQRYQSEGGYPDEDRDRGYSRLGGAGEEDYERYRQGGYQQGAREYDREYSGRDYYGRDYSDERGYYGPERSYDYGRRSDYSQRGQYVQGQFRQHGYGQSGPSWLRNERGRFAGLGPKGYKRSDERIREDLCDALMMDPEIDATDVEIKVSDGEVTISGTVQDREDKWRAEQLAESIPGVRDVNNTIRAKRSGSEQSASANDTSQRAARGGAQSGTSNLSQSGAGNSTRA